MINATTNKNPMARVMSIRDFRLLFIGAATSLLGDQFTFIATPWLVLKLTSDPLVLGVVMALEGIPRAVFMLLGGAITDRFSPRIIMLVSDLIRLILTALMAFVVITGIVQMWMVYVFGLGFGLVAGFSIPANNSIVPMLVKKEDLQAGNSIIMGISQLVGFIGPSVAGILISRYSSSFMGIGMAFAVDSLSFTGSAVCLWLIRTGNRSLRADDSIVKQSVWTSILSGVKYLWNDQILRFIFLVLTAVNFLIVGPLLVGIPVLADQRLPEGAVAYGILMSGHAGGNLAGYLLAGSLPRPRSKTIRIMLITLIGAFGLGVGSLGFIPITSVDFVLLFLLGLGNGYISIILYTWMQTRVPVEMLGRMMSLLMFSNLGLVPISQAISGAISKWDLTLLFASTGVLVLLVTLWTSLQPGLKTFSESLTATSRQDDSAQLSST